MCVCVCVCVFIPPSLPVSGYLFNKLLRGQQSSQWNSSLNWQKVVLFCFLFFLDMPSHNPCNSFPHRLSSLNTNPSSVQVTTQSFTFTPALKKCKLRYGLMLIYLLACSLWLTEAVLENDVLERVGTVFVRRLLHRCSTMLSLFSTCSVLLVKLLVEQMLWLDALVIKLTEFLAKESFLD